MYVTRSLSQLPKFPDTVSASVDGPNLGYLVIQDNESKLFPSLQMFKNRTLENLPFPQNKELMVRYQTGGDNSHVTHDAVFLIPVLNQPLSSNRYYAIVPHKKHKGKAFTSSTEEDMSNCFSCCFKDIKPRPLDPNNIYQQFEIHPYESRYTPKSSFFAKSTALDGVPPHFLRRRGHWTIYTKRPDHFKLDEALGIDSKLRAQLPEFNTSTIVGKWYCPFMFVKEGTLTNQVENSMYYNVTLEQRWEKIFTSKESRGNSVVIDVELENEEVFIDGNKATLNDKNIIDGVVSFTSHNVFGGQINVGLRREVVERMKWEQGRGGWLSGEEKRVKINRIEEFKKGGELACYVLVERFDFKRTDRSLAMSYDFKHSHQIKIKWE